MTLKVKKLITVIIGIAISVGLMTYLYYGIDFGELATALAQVNYWLLIPNVILVMVTMIFRAYRWQYMILPIKKVPFSRLFSITMIGFMANNVLPLRLGELVRAYSLSAREKVTKSASLATIFVERMVFDLLALLIIFAVVLIYSPLDLDKFSNVAEKIGMTPDTARYLLLAIISVGLLGLLLAFYLSRRSGRDSRIMKIILSILPISVRPSVEETVVKFSSGMEFMRDRKCVSWVIFHTFMIWLVLGLSNYFILIAFFGTALPLTASFVILVIVSILITIPSSPGFVGVFHAGAIIALGLYPTITSDENMVKSCALVMHATQYIVITVVGFYYMRTEHLSFKQIELDAEQVD